MLPRYIEWTASSLKLGFEFLPDFKAIKNLGALHRIVDASVLSDTVQCHSWVLVD